LWVIQNSTEIGKEIYSTCSLFNAMELSSYTVSWPNLSQGPNNKSRYLTVVECTTKLNYSYPFNENLVLLFVSKLKLAIMNDNNSFHKQLRLIESQSMHFQSWSIIILLWDGYYYLMIVCTHIMVCHYICMLEFVCHAD